jgi:hypothetical protein
MQLLHISLLLAAVASTVSADFSVLSRITTAICYEEDCEAESEDKLILCGRQELGCGCYSGSGATSIDYEGTEMSEDGYNLFTYGLCGGRPGAIELTRKVDGSWDVREQGAPSVVVGNCVEDRSMEEHCGVLGVYNMVVGSKLYCTSPLCG